MRLQAISAALHHAAKLGITSVQDVSPVNDFHLYQQLARRGELTCRINAVMPIESYTEYLHRAGIEYHFGSPLLRLGSVKCFSDGSMGAGSALLFEPYTDDGATSGLAIYPKTKLMELIAAAHKNNLQVYCHAIGDKANRWVLDAFEAAAKKYGQKDLRHRIEHAQLVARGDFQRFSALDVIASVQPSHCIDDMRWAETRIGKKRCNGLYAFRSFLDAGANIAFGTDWPVENLNPMIGLYAAVTREFSQGGPAGGWFPKQKIELEEAVKAYTSGAAYAEHEEQNKGSIEPGKLADLIVLDLDIFSVPPKEILSAKVDLTMVGGKVVFVRD
ncbi:MAG TPA: amidohydrolase [Bacteroidetes bacterium]|nr:amidohydrolase [Bacteroidota bacterium]